VKALTFTLRQRPPQRLDLSPLVPHILAGKSAAEIAAIELQTTRTRVNVGEIFRVRMGDAEHIRIEGACDRLDHVGQSMTGGELLADGDVGIQAGRLMTAGRLTLRGNVGPWAASGMKGGVIEVQGAADDWLGAPLAGEIAGMRGGVVIVRGRAGARAGDRMRRGTIVIEGETGAYPGSRMIAGTLIVAQKAGPLPGFLMKRGTIVLGAGCSAISPTFVDCGRHALLAMRLWAGFIAPYSKRAASLLEQPLQRFAGDMAVLGKGEIFIGNRN
jgi:formylmethanofuran dehydrogenase subunit C